MLRWVLVCLFLIVYQQGSLCGHDLWLVPPETVKTGQKITIQAHSGMEFPLSEHAPNPVRFKKLYLIGPDGKNGELAPAGTEDKSGLLTCTLSQPGIHILAVQTEPKLITLEAAEFNHYLVSDGLPHIYELRHKEKSLDQPGKERYSKSPKALVRVEGSNQGDASRVMGLTLEIVPLCNPFALKPGGTLPVQVYYLGKPLAEAHLGWDHPGDGPAATGTVRTNAEGKALIPISQTGLMTVRLTHMTRPKAKDYEWESYWTTLTWRVEEK